MPATIIVNATTAEIASCVGARTIKSSGPGLSPLVVLVSAKEGPRPGALKDAVRSNEANEQLNGIALYILYIK